jgi:hypothetical protein
MSQIKNAKIDSTMLGYEDHGLLTFSLALDYGDCFQCVGGYRLDGYDKKSDKIFYSSTGLRVLAEIIKVAGVSSWEKLKGSYIRVKIVDNHVKSIGHLLEDNWVDFEELFKQQP